jgi:stalled ribosome rescue protein Dom34
MALVHAVVRLDHHSADIMRFNASVVKQAHLAAHRHNTPQRNSAVRDLHEFFAEVCDALAGLDAILITGNRASLSDFRHYIEKHRPGLIDAVIAYETIDQPTDSQLIARARDYFDKYERMA